MALKSIVDELGKNGTIRLVKQDQISSRVTENNAASIVRMAGHVKMLKTDASYDSASSILHAILGNSKRMMEVHQTLNRASDTNPNPLFGY